MGEEFTVRRAGASDAAAVRALSRTAYQQWVPLIGRQPLPMTADYDRAVTEHVIHLREEDGQLLGLVEMVPGGDHLLIENIAVRPSHQGQGLGGRLLRHAEELARSLGLAETRLYTNAAFASNLAFYARRGYQAYRHEAIAQGGTIVFMRKALAAPR